LGYRFHTSESARASIHQNQPPTKVATLKLSKSMISFVGALIFWRMSQDPRAIMTMAPRTNARAQILIQDSHAHILLARGGVLYINTDVLNTGIILKACDS
jgi:hypothetical protein